jgi:GNAT superfamily N-acetyltransferase
MRYMMRHLKVKQVALIQKNLQIFCDQFLHDMKIKKTTEQNAYSIKFTIEHNGSVVAWAYLVVVHAARHTEPFGLLENVYVEEEYRGQGLGTQLIEAAIAEAKQIPCYKLIAQSRYGKERLHDMYLRLGFRDHGKNFRMDIVNSEVKQRD